MEQFEFHDVTPMDIAGVSGIDSPLISVTEEDGVIIVTMPDLDSAQRAALRKLFAHKREAVGGPSVGFPLGRGTWNQVKKAVSKVPNPLDRRKNKE